MKKLTSLTLAVLMAVTMLVPFTAQAAAKPEKTGITSLSSDTGSVTVKWQKKKVSGYQVFYSTSSSFKNCKKYTIRKRSTVSKRIKNLKSGKKYYVKVRTFNKTEDETKFSKWSKVKSVTVKKKAKKRSAKKSSSGTKTGSKVYVTPTGKRYHYDPDCGGVNSTPCSLSDAKARGLTPCQKCAS